MYRRLARMACQTLAGRRQATATTTAEEACLVAYRTVGSRREAFHLDLCHQASSCEVEKAQAQLLRSKGSGLEFSQATPPAEALVAPTLAVVQT